MSQGAVLIYSEANVLKYVHILPVSFSALQAECTQCCCRLHPTHHEDYCTTTLSSGKVEKHLSLMSLIIYIPILMYKHVYQNIGLSVTLKYNVHDTVMPLHNYYYYY